MGRPKQLAQFAQSEYRIGCPTPIGTDRRLIRGIQCPNKKRAPRSRLKLPLPHWCVTPKDRDLDSREIVPLSFSGDAFPTRLFKSMVEVASTSALSGGLNRENRKDASTVPTKTVLSCACVVVVRSGTLRHQFEGISETRSGVSIKHKTKIARRGLTTKTT